MTAENVEIKQQMTVVQETNVELEKVKEELTSKVTVASVIQAKDVVAVALNKKRKETDELRNLDKVRVCFTLRENPIAAGRQQDRLPESCAPRSAGDNSLTR
ncbi:MAG: hypothetical protein MZV63_71705 [Marinilabiliales bacterium]|nr:hypothetical protein [Marinilabiliales bacterium]